MEARYNTTCKQHQRNTSPIRSKMLGGAISAGEFKKKNRQEQTLIIRQFLKTKGYPELVINSIGISKKITNRRCSDKKDDDYIKCVLNEVARQIIHRECNNKDATAERLAKKLQGELLDSLSGRSTTPMTPSTTRQSMDTFFRTEQHSFKPQKLIGQSMSQEFIRPERTMGFTPTEMVQSASNSKIVNEVFQLEMNSLWEASKKRMNLIEKISELKQQPTSAQNTDRIAGLQKELADKNKEIAEAKQAAEGIKEHQEKAKRLEQELEKAQKELADAKKTSNLAAQKDTLDQAKKVKEQLNEENRLINKKLQELQEQKEEEIRKLQEQAILAEQEKKKAAAEVEKLRKELAAAQAKANNQSQIETLKKELVDANAASLAAIKENEDRKSKVAELNNEIEILEKRTQFNADNKQLTPYKDDQEDFNPTLKPTLEVLINDSTPVETVIKRINKKITQPLKDYEIKYLLEQIIKNIGLEQKYQIWHLESGIMLGGSEEDGRIEIMSNNEAKALEEAEAEAASPASDEKKLAAITSQNISHETTENVKKLLKLYTELVKKIPEGKTSTVNFPILDDNFDGFDSQENFEEFYEKLSGITVSEKPKPIQVKPVELPADLLDNTGEDTDSGKYQKAKRILNYLAGFFKKLNKYYEIFPQTSQSTKLAANTTNYEISKENNENAGNLITKLNTIIAKLNEGKADSDKIPELDSNNLAESFPAVMTAIKNGIDAEKKKEQEEKKVAENAAKEAAEKQRKEEAERQRKEAAERQRKETAARMEKAIIPDKEETPENKESRARLEEANNLIENFKIGKSDPQKKEIDDFFPIFLKEVAKNVQIPKGTEDNPPTANNYKKAFTDFSTTYREGKTDIQKAFIDYFIGEYTKNIGVSVSSENRLQELEKKRKKEEEANTAAVNKQKEEYTQRQNTKPIKSPVNLQKQNREALKSLESIKKGTDSSIQQVKPTSKEDKKKWLIEHGFANKPIKGGSHISHTRKSSGPRKSIKTNKNSHNHKRLQMIPQTLKLTSRYK